MWVVGNKKPAGAASSTRERVKMSPNVDRVREIMRLADEMRVDDLIPLFADDAVMELPFAPGKMARSHVGRAAIADFQRFARDTFSQFSMSVEAIHETVDPHVVIAEHRSAATAAGHGRPYPSHYV